MTLPYKFKVVDIPTLNKWTEDYYIPTVFRQDPVYDPIPGRIAHHNQMVTGATSLDLWCAKSIMTFTNMLQGGSSHFVNSPGY